MNNVPSRRMVASVITQTKGSAKALRQEKRRPCLDGQGLRIGTDVNTNHLSLRWHYPDQVCGSAAD
jgi:hypothetical protein